MESEGEKSGEGERGKRIEDPSNILGGDRAEIFQTRNILSGDRSNIQGGDPQNILGGDQLEILGGDEPERQNLELDENLMAWWCSDGRPRDED